MKSALNAFETLCRNDSANVNLSMYDSIMAAKVPTINDEIEKMAFISGVSTGRSSTIYWEANKSKWDSLANDLGGGNGFASLACCSGKDIVYADIAGGVGGLVRGALVGAAGGTVVVPGVGTVTGAAAGRIGGWCSWRSGWLGC